MERLAARASRGVCLRLLSASYGKYRFFHLRSCPLD
jgi:hypothetical protein